MARWKRIGTTAAIWLAAAAAFPLFFVAMENSLLYFPTRALDRSPADEDLESEDLTLRAEDGVALRGWRILGTGQTALLFFHGNAGNVSHRLERARHLRERFGLDVFLVDYRGYGLSEGKPSEEGLARDARAIHAAAVERGFPPERIVLFGESLGSAVAIRLAGERPCAAAILETPFLSIAAMARTHYPFVPRFLIRSRYDNGERIARVAIPKLFVLAERDEIVPVEQGRRLFALAAEPKTLYVVSGASHNDTYVVGGEPYWKAVGAFLGQRP
jgi:fermentation-respiration switch protein FrsA (DUF1100 family)